MPALQGMRVVLGTGIGFGQVPTMRFDEYVRQRGAAVTAVDQFAAFTVEVGIPPYWEPFDSTLGAKVWGYRRDPHINEFCANAVLTTHQVDASLDAREVVTALSDQQAQSVPDSYELRRDLTAAGEGPGVLGSLALQMPCQFGAIDSKSSTRFITTEQEILIAQLYDDRTSRFVSSPNTGVDRSQRISATCDAGVRGQPDPAFKQ